MNLQFEGIEKFEIQDHLVIINKNQSESGYEHG